MGKWMVVGLVLWAFGCNGSTEDSNPPPEGDPATVELAGPCPMATDYGGFVVEAYEDYSIVAGKVADGMVPITVLEEVGAEGGLSGARAQRPLVRPPL